MTDMVGFICLAGLAAALAASTACAVDGGRTGSDASAAPTPSPAKPGDADQRPTWVQQADARIERIREGDFVVTLSLPAGRQAPDGIAMQVTQTRSHFHFGTAINTNLADPKTADDENEARYRRFIIEHFNTLVDENYMKWYSVERQRDQVTFARPDAYLAFAREHDMTVRGHCLFWAKEKFVKFQPWLLTLSPEELKAEMDEHLEAIVPRYRGKLIAWDVNNEMLHGHWYADQLGEGIRPWMFKRAHELDPQTPLYVNDYAILGDPEKTQAYIEQIRWLQREGAPVGGIGVQEHACERIVLDRAEDDDRPERQGQHHVTPEQILASLDALAELDLPIHLTEVSARTKDQQARADAIEAIMRIAYSHPKVDAILLWGFWARRHWLGADAALVSGDWTLTPAGERLQQLLLHEWRTRTEVPVSNGRVRFRGFYGDYQLRLAIDGVAYVGKVRLTPEQREVEIELHSASDDGVEANESEASRTQQAE